jgi:hypothetical protein
VTLFKKLRSIISKSDKAAPLATTAGPPMPFGVKRPQWQQPIDLNMVREDVRKRNPQYLQEYVILCQMAFRGDVYGT